MKLIRRDRCTRVIKLSPGVPAVTARSPATGREAELRPDPGLFALPLGERLIYVKDRIARRKTASAAASRRLSTGRRADEPFM